MKTKLFNFIIIGTLLVTGVVSAQGWQPPEDNFPNGNANAPVHVGNFEQRKSGGFWAKYFHAGTQATTTELLKIIGNVTSFFAGDKVVIAPTGIFTRVFLPGNNAHLRVGTIQGDNNGAGLFNALSDSKRAPAVIDLRERSGSHKVDGLALLKSSAVCTTDLAMVTNTPGIHFWSDKNNASADLIARQIRLAGGNPTPGAVLVSVDSSGNAVWGIPKMVKDGTGWVLQYDYNVSPVASGLLICENITPVNECPNLPNGPYATIPSGYRKDSSGNCVQNFCPNISTWTESGLPNHAGVTWTGGNGSNCIPNSCDTALIGTSILGVTVGKSNDCPIQRVWDRVAMFAIQKGNPDNIFLWRTNPSINVYSGKAMDVAYFNNTQYDTSNNAERFRVGILTKGSQSRQLNKIIKTDKNIDISQIQLESWAPPSVMGTYPVPDRYVEKSFIYRSVINIEGINGLGAVDCKVLPAGQNPPSGVNAEKWEDDPMIRAANRITMVRESNRNNKIWVPAYSCIKSLGIGPLGGFHNMPSITNIEEWQKQDNGGSRPGLDFQGDAYQLEYLFPAGLTEDQRFRYTVSKD